MKIKLFINQLIRLVCFYGSITFADLGIDSRLCQLESEMKEVRTTTIAETSGASTASAVPKILEQKGLFLGIGGNFFNVILGSESFGNEDDRLFGQRSSRFIWGIDTKVGYSSILDSSYISANFSYLNTSFSSVSNGHVFTTKLSGPTPLFFPFNPGAKGISGVDYKLLGLELGRDFYISRFFSLKPSLGLLSNWMNLSEKQFLSKFGANEDMFYVRDNLDWFGLGPQFGLVMNLDFKKGFSLFSALKGALMYGNMNPTHKEFDSADEDNQLEMKKSFKRLVPYIDMKVGFGYGFITNNQKNHLNFRLGLEMQDFINVNQMIYPIMINDQKAFKTQSKSVLTGGYFIDGTWSF